MSCHHLPTITVHRSLCFLLPHNHVAPVPLPSPSLERDRNKKHNKTKQKRHSYIILQRNEKHELFVFRKGKGCMPWNTEHLVLKQNACKNVQEGRISSRNVCREQKFSKTVCYKVKYHLTTFSFQIL